MTRSCYSKSLAGQCAFALGLIVVSAVHAAAPAPSTFVMTSTTFQDGGQMPSRVAGAPPPGGNNANCVGQNASPQLSWSGAPAGTKSFAITLWDPEGRNGGEYHWIAYGIPANVTSLAEGEAAKGSKNFMGGKAKEAVGQGVATYSGPCTPLGPAHHYIFKLMATDIDPSELTAGMDLADLEKKFDRHYKGTSVLVGLYQRQ